MRPHLFLQLAVLLSLSSPVLANEAHRPAAPAGLQAANSVAVAGTVTLTWQAVKGATEYVVAASRETEASWQSVATTTEPSYEFADLPEGTKYYFRVSCHTKTGQSEWSTAVMLNTASAKSAMGTLPPAAKFSVVAKSLSR
jgi:hypothetical protein